MSPYYYTLYFTQYPASNHSMDIRKDKNVRIRFDVTKPNAYLLENFFYFMKKMVIS